jgi:hypothetical protein
MNTSSFYQSQHQRIEHFVTPSKDDFSLDLSFLDEYDSSIHPSCNPMDDANPMDATTMPRGKALVTPAYLDDSKLELESQLKETRRELAEVKQDRDQGTALNHHLVQELGQARINLEYERDMHKSHVQHCLDQQCEAHQQAFDKFLSHTLPQNVSLFPSRLILGADGSIRNYMVGATLGAGAFGSVVVGSHISTKRRVAIKILSTNTTVDVSDEVEALTRVNHPNVIKMYECIADDAQDKFGLVMEQGVVDLRTCMAEGNVFSLSVLREIALATLKAVQHVHSQGIAHLDIKPENILIMKRLPPCEIRQEHIRLCDFGLCTLAPTPGQAFISETDMKGTADFFAPEMADFCPYSANAADIWSIGATLLDLTEEIPEEWKHSYTMFHDTEDIGRQGFKTGLRRILRLMNEEDYFCHNPGFLPVFELALELLKMKPDQRLTASQALQHFWLQE